MKYSMVAEMVQKDFEKFDFADQPITKYCEYNKTKHIQLATQMTIQCFRNKEFYLLSEVKDFIHGLNHLFFNGVAAGQSFERFRGEDNEG